MAAAVEAVYQGLSQRPLGETLGSPGKP